MKHHFDILEKQEQMLRFEHFCQSDALALGTLMARRAQEADLTVAISIRLGNGVILFQYLPDGTNALNENWMRRKFNNVMAMSLSSLKEAFSMEEKGSTLADQGLNETDYALCGGGFPIRIRGSEVVIGAVVASNLYHIADHEFVTGALRKYLGCPDVPEYPFTLPE